MSRKEQLERMKSRELQKLATSLGIKHSRDLKKAEVIEAILKAENVEVQSSVQEEQSASDEERIDNASVEVATKVEKEATNTEVDMEHKMSYIDSAPIGTLVAFRLPGGKVKSAMITRKSSKNRKFELTTDYGAVYVTPYTDIVWVRTGKRWPRGVYQLLKGEA